MGNTKGLTSTQYDLLMDGVSPTLAREADKVAREPDKVARELGREEISEETRKEDLDLPLQGNLKSIAKGNALPEEPAGRTDGEVFTAQDALSIKNYMACSPVLRLYRAYVCIAHESGWPEPAPLTMKEENTLGRAIERIGGIDACINTLMEVERSAWLRGEVTKGWIPSLMWLMNKSKHIRSGKYRDRGRRE